MSQKPIRLKTFSSCGSNRASEKAETLENRINEFLANPSYGVKEIISTNIATFVIDGINSFLITIYYR